jgi:glycerol kinase
MIQQRTGLLLDPYFSATKMEWMLVNRPDVRAAGDKLAFGTVDSWLLWKLTGGTTPRHGCQQCQPDHADGAGLQRLGSAALRAIPH